MLVVRKFLLIFLMSAVFFAAAAEVSITLESFLVTFDSNGRIVYSPATAAKPGDTLQYRATYQNTSRSTVNNVVATLPIPEGTTYLANTAFPPDVVASVDGSTFAPPPLMRRAIVNGRIVESPVPLTEYRFLRWVFPTLTPRQKQVVGARVVVNR
jgi:uncharacterized repeat protein (TIGR01451 family)